MYCVFWVKYCSYSNYLDVPNPGEKLKRYYLAVSSMAVSDTLPWCRLDYHTQEWDTDFRANLKQLDSKKPLILCTWTWLTRKLYNRTHTLKHSWSSSIVILFLLRPVWAAQQYSLVSCCPAASRSVTQRLLCIMRRERRIWAHLDN